MKKILKYIKSDRLIFFCFLTSIILFLISFLIIIIYYRFLPLFIPIFNQMPWGYGRLGSKIEILIPLGISLLFLIINTQLDYFLKEKNFLLSRFSFLTLLLINILNLVFTLRIIFLIR